MKYVKEKLKGTCVLNESVEMGAKIVALYTEAGFNNRYLMEGLDIDSYYGCDMNGDIDCTDEENTIFDKVLTLDQLREIVRGEKQPFNLSDTGAFSSEPVEFKEGEMVEYSNNKHTWIKGVFIMIWKGKYVIENQFGDVCYYEFIRKIDKDKELKDLAETIAKKYVFGKHDALIDRQEVIDMTNDIVEAMKKVQSKK